MPVGLRGFQPGNQLGGHRGPADKPKHLTMSLKGQINALHDKGDPYGRTKMDVLVAKLIALGIEGEQWAIEFIWNRLEGPVKTVSELRNAEGESLKIELIRHVIVDPGADMKTIDAAPIGAEVKAIGSPSEEVS